MRVRLEGLSPGQKIYLAGDSEDVEGEGDWHGDLQGPYDSEAIMKALGFTTFSPGLFYFIFFSPSFFPSFPPPFFPPFPPFFFFFSHCYHRIWCCCRGRRK